jgi:geranylgeranyl pyrophosphate synthase
MSSTASKTSFISNLVARGLSADFKSTVSLAFSSVSGGLSEVENNIRKELQSDSQTLVDIPAYLLGLGGKRIRPLLCLLTAKLFNLELSNQTLIDTASGIELIHMATLLHDDIIDESPLRRSKTSAYKKYGLASTLLAGDFLLVKAFGLCAKLDKFIITETERACVELTEGEILEGTLDSNSGKTLEQYLIVVGKKTASLFSLATATATFIAGRDQKIVETMKMFGLYTGIAFQMVDDILDIVADEDLLGKPSGTDLKQKTPSLINILWLNSGDERAKTYFAIESPTMEQAKEAANYLKTTSIIEEARTLAEQYIERAKNSLSAAATVNANLNTKAHLVSILDYTLNRCL